MSHWQYWPASPNSGLNFQLGNVESYGHFNYPNLRRETSDLVLASDYSGEHDQPQFQVLSFLLTNERSMQRNWEPFRLAVRNRYLTENRRMSFKRLSDAQRINALPSFLRAAGQLDGILVSVAFAKSHSFRNRNELPPLKHSWTPDVLEKLLHIAAFAGGFVSGLRGFRQNLFWITDDDAIVVNENAKDDASRLMGGFLETHPDEHPVVKLGIGSLFDDELRAEDLLAIPDLAAGAFSDLLMQSNLSTTDIEHSPEQVLQTKSTLINGWLADNSKRLKYFHLVVRTMPDGQDALSFGQPSCRIPAPTEQFPAVAPLNEKWRRSLTNWQNRNSIRAR